ncbi:MAG TPA: hypothetical protein VHY84_26245 [Bryobacteraceae bacterium]|jgi:hypothetical protein|nr:hypothetical protein [Bryobacteraceae bacterium]
MATEKQIIAERRNDLFNNDPFNANPDHLTQPADNKGAPRQNGFEFANNKIARPCRPGFEWRSSGKPRKPRKERPVHPHSNSPHYN